MGSPKRHCPCCGVPDCPGCPASVTLRDMFAAQAMQGMLASPGRGQNAAELAREAWKMADEMIARRG